MIRLKDIILKEDYSNNPLHNMDLRDEIDLSAEFLKGLKIALESELDADRVYQDLESMAKKLPDGPMKEAALIMLHDIRGEELKHIGQENAFIKKFSSDSDKQFLLKGDIEGQEQIQGNKTDL